MKSNYTNRRKPCIFKSETKNYFSRSLWPVGFFNISHSCWLTCDEILWNIIIYYFQLADVSSKIYGRCAATLLYHIQYTVIKIEPAKWAGFKYRRWGGRANPGTFRVEQSCWNPSCSVSGMGVKILVVKNFLENWKKLKLFDDPVVIT